MSIGTAPAIGRRRVVGSVSRVLVLTLAVVVGSRAAALLTREEALAAAYPNAAIREERIFLTNDQRQQAAVLAGASPPTALIVRYVAIVADRVVGRAYVDTHIVRTKKETLLVLLDAGGRVKRVEVTAFLEPMEYVAPDAWKAQYHGRPLSEDLRLGRAIRPIAGATLTARATTEAVRRVLAIDRVLERVQ